jgi:hypothetical protein
VASEVFSVEIASEGDAVRVKVCAGLSDLILRVIVDAEDEVRLRR